MDTRSDVDLVDGLPVQQDHVSFRGILWFMAIVVVTCIVCEGIIVGMFKYFEYDTTRNDIAAAPTALPAGMPAITAAGVEPTRAMPEPLLLTDDPDTLARFRAEEDQLLTTYGVSDKNARTYRIPIEQAKKLLLAKGLPTRPAPGK